MSLDLDGESCPRKIDLYLHQEFVDLVYGMEECKGVTFVGIGPSFYDLVGALGVDDDGFGDFLESLLILLNAAGVVVVNDERLVLFAVSQNRYLNHFYPVNLHSHIIS